MVALARFFSERWVGEASFRLKLEAEGFAEEARKIAHVVRDLDSEGVQVKGFVSEGLLHGYSAQLPFIPQLVVEKHKVSVRVNPRLNTVQYKYTTYLVSMPDVPDYAIHVGIGYVARSEGSAGFWAFVPVDVAVPMAVIRAAIEDLFHDFGIGDAASGLLGVFIWAEPADGLETGCCGVFRQWS